MKNHFLCHLSVLLLVMTFPAFAQEKPAKNVLVFEPGATAPDGMPVPAKVGAKLDESLKTTVGDFYAALEKKQIDEAYELLTKGTKIAEKPADINTLKSQTKKAIEFFGEILGYEVTEVNPVGTHLLRLTCMSIGKDFPLRWKFYFYRADREWKLIDLRVDDRLIDLFNEPEPATGAGGTRSSDLSQ